MLSTNGDTYLGGDDFDRAIMEVVAGEIGINLSNKDPELLQHLRDAAERTKIALSTEERATFKLTLPQGSRFFQRFERTFTRSEFEELIRPLVDRSINRCRSALKDANLSPKNIDEVVLVGGSTRIPYIRKRVAEFFGRTPHSDLNPDEVVAIGAAIQADILTSGRRDMLLLDVVPLSLGIETLGGVVDKVIHRNTTVPCRATTRYTTFAENQTAILLNIYQGERELTKDCRLLGTFKLSGIPPMPAQFAKVDVTFLVNQDGMLTVAAKEERSGAQAQVTVRPAHGLTRDEVEELVNDSVQHAEEDFTTRRVIELPNKAAADMRHTEKALAEAGDKLSAEQRERITTATAALRTASTEARLDRLQHALEAFGAATNPLAQIIMNSVLRKSLGGEDPGKLDPTKL